MVGQHALPLQWPLVGRAELLDSIATTVMSDAAAVVILCGPSGVGKSRLAAEAGALVAARNWLVLPITASATVAAIPLGAVAPVLFGGRPDDNALFDQARASVEHQANGRPVLVIVDDLWLLDSLSLAVLTQLVEAGVITLIATLRTGEPMPDAILSMWTSNRALRVDVPVLSVDDFEEVLSIVLAGPVSRRTAVTLHNRSGGNPLYLRELVLGALEAGELVTTGGVWQVTGAPTGTPALHDLIRSRLRHLDPESLDIVERLAVCQPLALRDLPGNRAKVVALERDGIVTVTDDLQVSLAHPQYVSAVRSSLSRLRTVDLLLDSADIVSARAVSPDDELRIATWRLDAGDPTDHALLARAANLAVIAQDHDAVMRLADAAMAAGASAAEMLFLQGEAMWTLGRNTEALALLERAAAADTDDVDLSVQIATALASTHAQESGGNRRGLAVLDAVITRYPTHARPLALSRAVLLLNLEEAELAAAELVTAQPRTDSEEQRQAILDLSRAMPLSALGRATEALEAAEAAVAHAGRPRPVYPLRRAQMVHATVLLQSGRPAEALAITLESLHDAIDHDDELSTRYNEFMLGRCYLALGRLDVASRWFRDVISGAQARGPIAYLEQANAQLALTLAWHAQTDAAATLSASLTDEFVITNTHATITREWIAATTGDSAGATARLLAHASTVAARGHSVLAAAVLHIAARLGAASAAADELEALAARTDSPLIAAQAAHARAEASGDIGSLTAVADEWERQGSTLFAAEAVASAARAATRQELGREATALQARADALIARSDNAATPLLQFVEKAEPLTKREREIANLAAQGLSSTDIAERLFLSPRTVNNHLQSVYTKLGIRGRSEL